MEGKRRRAERLLRADPGLNANAVARVVGCSVTTVKHVRAKLGPPRRVTKVKRCEAVLRAEPGANLDEVAEAVGCSYGTAYSAATRLGINRDRKHGSQIGQHRQWHVGRGRTDPECQLCREGVHQAR